MVNLLEHVVLPVANETDARITARQLAQYEPNQVTTVHVVEKGGGVPDKTPVEHSQRVAEDAYAAVRAVFPDAEDQTAYARDIVAAIVATAVEVDASAVAYRSRTGNRLMQMLSGDLSLKLVTNTTVPVIALPRVESEE